VSTGPSAFAKGPERVVYDGYVIQVAVGEFTAPNGEVVQRDLIHHPGAVSVVPIDGDEVILVRQFRAALGHDLLEIPAGKRDLADEPLEVCAARELAEEIGMAAASLVKVASFYNSAGFCDELSHVFIGTGLTAVPSSAHGLEEEYMSIERHPLDTIPALIAAGELCDAKSIIGLLLALRRLGR
jgi:8-oxo-dGTP pyrophosphatase MutT (NUDIX family)